MAFQIRTSRMLAALTPLVACASSLFASGEPRWIPGMPGVGIDDGVGIYVMEVFDDGSGPALYVGGAFQTAGGVSVDGIARWNGTSWSAVGSGLVGEIISMKALDDGSGPALYVAGETVGIGSTLWSIAKWDGTSWRGVVPSTFGPDVIRDLLVFDDGLGGGRAICAVGTGWNMDGRMTQAVAKWTNTGWQFLGDGLIINSGKSLGGYAVVVFDDGRGDGSCLYVAGSFIDGPIQPMQSLARWNGRNWSAVGAGPPSVWLYALTEFDADGAGPDQSVLLAAGKMNHRSEGVFAWDGSSWSALGMIDTLVGHSWTGTVRALGVIDVGSRRELMISGDFGGEVTGGCIRRWDGTTWVTLGIGAGSDDPTWFEWYPSDLASFDDGSSIGPALFLGGPQLIWAGGYWVEGIARWGVPVEVTCSPDILPTGGGDAQVNIVDLLQVISAWGPCANPCFSNCLSDVNGDCTVNIADLLVVIAHWGPCPGSWWE